jgi:hypothetical protein
MKRNWLLDEILKTPERFVLRICTLKQGTRKKTHFLLRGMSFLFLWPILKKLKNNTYAKQSKNYDIIDFMTHIIFKRYNPYFI